MRFVLSSAEEVRIFVRLEVRHAHDHLFRRERGCYRSDALGDLGHIEFRRAVIAADSLADLCLEVRRLRIEIDQRLRMHAHVSVDDELEPRQPDAIVGQLAKLERQLRIADIQHDLGRRSGHLVQCDIDDFYLGQALVDVSGVTLGTRNGDPLLFSKNGRRIAATDHRRNA